MFLNGGEIRWRRALLLVLLNIFYKIWIIGQLPNTWSEATVILIPKPGKDSTNPNNYQPIALTSCVCETLEHMVNDRLVCFLEQNKLITEILNGFRKGRSTVDQLVQFETFIREAFTQKHRVVSVFFDLEKAYDITWKGGILRGLHKAGLRGRLPVFIAGFFFTKPSFPCADRLLSV
jgi:Reverse transcriptase (RNA-dependent DNA polymerase)